MQRVSSLMMFAVVGLSCLLSFATSATAQNPTISGQVTDKKGQGIRNINIMVRRGMATIATVETRENGNYTIDYRPGKAVAVLFNGNTEWYPEVVENVVGNNNINKQLINTKETPSPDEWKRIEKAFDYLRGVPGLAKEFREYLKNIDPSLLPPELQPKFFQDHILARLSSAEEELSATVTKNAEIEANAQRLSGQVEEMAAVSNAARGGAKAAQATADAAVAGVNATNERIAAIDEYEMRPDLSVSVEFTGSNVNLTAEARKILDQLAVKIVATKGYTLTISGFADGTPGSVRSIRISQLRAEAVARYLTANYEIPLWRVRAILGYGASQTVGGKKPLGPANRVDVTTLVNRGLSTPAPTMNPGLDQ